MLCMTLKSAFADPRQITMLIGGQIRAHSETQTEASVNNQSAGAKVRLRASGRFSLPELKTLGTQGCVSALARPGDNTGELGTKNCPTDARHIRSGCLELVCFRKVSVLFRGDNRTTQKRSITLSRPISPQSRPDLRA